MTAEHPMQNSIQLYWFGLILGLFLAGILFWRRGKKQGLSSVCLSTALGLAVVLGLIGAKLLYIAIRGEYLLPTYGWRAFFRLKKNEFALGGAVLGVMTALWAAGRLVGQPASRLLDVLAPGGLLMIACARFSEYFADFGLGHYIESPAWQFFPYGMVNEYGEWYQSVFLLEALFALIAFAVVLRASKHGALQPGRLALVLWALPQIFSESFRNESLRWGFVRVQQVLCAVLSLAVMASFAVQVKKQGRRVSAWPFAVFLLGIALCIGVEFALDKTHIPRMVCYGAMILALTGVGGATLWQMQATKATGPEQPQEAPPAFEAYG